MPIPGNFLSPTTEQVDPNASGWKAKLNCTVSLGSGGRNGDGCLAVKSVAAGEMQAITVSTYEVTPWTEYYAWSDASGASEPERIGIRWLDAAGAEISVTWSLTTATASASWHRISVGGEAPAGAARAAVVFSATPAAANVIHYWENVYFGYPQRYQGNLLQFNTESAEIDASGWFAEVNSTVARVAPVIPWTATMYPIGGHVMAMTATAAGNASMRSTDRPDATPGVEYTAYAYLNPPSSTANAWVELRFYDADGIQIHAARGPLVVPGTGWYRQYASAIAPAATASCSIAVGIDGATAGQVLRVEGVVVAVVQPARAGNIVPYADSEFEQGVAGWSVVSGTATFARSSPWGTAAFSGAYSGTITSATASTSTIRSGRFTLPAGDSFRMETYFMVSAGGWSWARAVRWYSADDTDLGVTSTAVVAASTPGWWVDTASFTAPEGATQAAIEYTVTATAANSVLRLDRIAMWQALALSDAVADDSTATITVTQRELPTGDVISVWRVDPAGMRTLVRGPSGLLNSMPITADLMVIEDAEAPLDVPVSYYVETRNATSGVLTSTRTTVIVTLTLSDPEEAWLKDPSNPQRNAKVLVKQPPDWKRSIEQARHRVRGRRNPVVLSDVRAGLEGDLILWTRSDDERARLHWLLDSGNTLFLQTAPGRGISDMYVTVGEVPEARDTPEADDPWRVWTLPLSESDMPTTAGVNGSAGRTWRDPLTEITSWADLMSQYATWEDVFFGRRIGG